jgi:dolichol-phosphate mannosyltransferase
MEAVSQSREAGSVPALDLTVALPVFNEAAILEELHRRVVGALDTTGLTYEVLYVDDGSSDGSDGIIRRLADEDPRVSRVRLSRNWGHAAALKAAIDFAQGASLVLMDADLQDDPAVIPRLLEVARDEGAEVVYVVRSERAEPKPVRPLFRLFHWSIARFSSFPVPQDAGSFGLLGPRALAEVRSLNERLRYFPGLRAFVGFKQASVEAPRAARYDQRSRVGMGGLVSLAAQAFFSQSRIPAMLFYVLSAVALVTSIGLVLYAAISRVVGTAIASWASIVTSVSFFSSVIILGLALVFEYLSRIYEEVRGRPVYLVEHVDRSSGSPRR